MAYYHLNRSGAKSICTIILFSIHYVLKTESILKKEMIVHDVVPVPRSISSDCGMAIDFCCEDLEGVKKLLSLHHIDIARMYRKDADGNYHEIRTHATETDEDR